MEICQSISGIGFAVSDKRDMCVCKNTRVLLARLGHSWRVLCVHACFWKRTNFWSAHSSLYSLTRYFDCTLHVYYMLSATSTNLNVKYVKRNSGRAYLAMYRQHGIIKSVKRRVRKVGKRSDIRRKIECVKKCLDEHKCERGCVGLCRGSLTREKLLDPLLELSGPKQFAHSEQNKKQGEQKFCQKFSNKIYIFSYSLQLCLVGFFIRRVSYRINTVECINV